MRRPGSYGRSTLLDLSDAEDLEPLAVVLGAVSRRAEALALEWILIGAAARDLIFRKNPGRSPTRATLDVDVAVEVADWSAYSALCDALIELEGARRMDGVAHRLVLPAERLLDLVPFGDVAAGGSIAWPPSDEPEMDVVGLADAHRHAEPVRLARGVELRIPTLENFLALKLLAWRDRHLDAPRRDSIELDDLLSMAGDLVDLETLYGEHVERLEAHSFEPRLAALDLIGSRWCELLGPDARRAVTELLRAESDDTGALGLVRDMRSGAVGLAGLRALRSGLERGWQK